MASRLGSRASYNDSELIENPRMKPKIKRNEKNKQER